MNGVALAGEIQNTEVMGAIGLSVQKGSDREDLAPSTLYVLSASWTMWQWATESTSDTRNLAIRDHCMDTAMLHASVKI